MSVLVVEQAPAWLLGVADDCYLLEVGRVVDHGSVEGVLDGIEKASKQTRDNKLPVPVPP